MRRSILSLVPAFVLLAACGDDIPNEFTTAGSADSSGTTATDTGAPTDLPDPDTGDGDGDGGDESPVTTGDGDGDAGDGDGDGDADPDTGVGSCGDGTVDIGEQCDGSDLNGFTCVDLGYAGGDLACDPVTCTYDASGCETDNDGGSSGGTSG
jgi:hypothetical protein